MTNPRQTPYKIDGKDSRMSRHKKAKNKLSFLIEIFSTHRAPKLSLQKSMTS